MICPRSSVAGRRLSVCLTFIAVVIAWVFFRADNLDAALVVLTAMVSPFADAAWQTQLFGGDKSKIYVWMIVLIVIVWGFPNVQQWGRYRPYNDESLLVNARDELIWFKYMAFRPSLLWAIALAGTAVYVVLHLTRVSEFLYFQF